MKSPEYVRDTARIWRRLLDEKRAATKEEMRELSEIFSRGGFTDGYYTQTIDRRMLGVRSEDDKSNSRTRDSFSGITRRCGLTVSASVKRASPIKLTISDGDHSVTVAGDVPMDAINAPLSYETVERNLTKLGGTLYAVKSFTLDLDPGLMLPLSNLNDLRRRALTALEETLHPSSLEAHTFVPNSPMKKREPLRTARFYSPEQLTSAAKRYFDRIYLPLERYTSAANGVVLPPIIFDSAKPAVEQMLRDAVAQGATHALVGNLGHLELIRETGLCPVADFRFNVTNRESVSRLETLGISEIILSPELTLPQIRDIGGNTSVMIYGRLPMMTLEKCVIREIADCSVCAENRAKICDRRGMDFPILREWEHRNVIYNSLPTCMSDREEELRRTGITARHFLFSTETPAAVDTVIRAHEKHLPLPETVRRIR